MVHDYRQILEFFAEKELLMDAKQRLKMFNTFVESSHEQIEEAKTMSDMDQVM